MSRARSASVGLVCASDALLASPRAMAELRSLASLKKPLVLAVIGGTRWERF